MGTTESKDRIEREKIVEIASALENCSRDERTFHLAAIWKDVPLPTLSL